MADLKKKFKAKGMTCDSCEKIIKKQVLKVKGVKSIDIDYSTEDVEVVYDDRKTDYDKIKKAVESKGYYCEDDRAYGKKPIIGWAVAIIGLLIAGYFAIQYFETIEFPKISQNMSYGLLFLVGLLTSLHCVSMCGGFVVSYTAKGLKEGKKPHQLHLDYAIGKVLSYTFIGAVFGLLGNIIAFTPMMRGMAGIFAGLFLLLYGLKMLNLFPSLRKLQLKTPGFITRYTANKQKNHSSPLMIGLLNGLMIACGPLQVIYIMAAGTGSMIEGAKLLFVFGIGTLPVMLAFGYLTSFIGKKATHNILKMSGVIVIVLGLYMINNGLVLTGTGYDFNTMISDVYADENTIDVQKEPVKVNEGYQEIRMEVNRYGFVPDTFVLKKGVPVKWIIDGIEINGCNNAILVPKLGLEFDINRGEQIIEFTPTDSGTIRWSCWMGMIPGSFIVKDDIDLDDDLAIREELKKAPAQSRGSCGGSCGSSTCDAATGGSCGCGGAR